MGERGLPNSPNSKRGESVALAGEVGERGEVEVEDGREPDCSDKVGTLGGCCDRGSPAAVGGEPASARGEGSGGESAPPNSPSKIDTIPIKLSFRLVLVLFRTVGAEPNSSPNSLVVLLAGVVEVVLWVWV